MFLTESSFQALSRDWCPGEDSRLPAAKHLICAPGQHPGAPCVPALCLGQPKGTRELNPSGYPARDI